MKKSKWLSILSVGALSASLFAPGAAAPQVEAASPYANWDVQKYGDRVDIDGYLNQLSQDDSYLKQAEQKLKEQAEGLFDGEEEAGDETTADPNFTYDGGTKKFLNRNLEFKDFTLRSVGDNVEIWVAKDLAYGPNNPKPADVVTQEQVDKLRDEFDSNIYPKATDFFGTPEALDGSNSPLPGMVGLPDDYYEGSDKVIMLVDNVKDEGWNNPSYPFFVAGFFWQTLENYMDRNIITIDSNSWDTRLESTFFGTTIHELQHLIQADHDGAEESWLNEGFSTFSEYLGGYGHDASSINFYLDHPENSLVNWDEHQGAVTGPETIADYGQTYLFTLYMYDKFGKEFIRDLATDGEYQGIESVNNKLIEDKTGKNFLQVYQNFMTALALDSDKVSNDYNFDSIDIRELPVGNTGEKRGKTVDFEQALTFEKEGVPAWGGDFKSLDFGKDARTLKFNGVDFLPLQWQTVTDPLDSGEQVLHGGNASEADHTLIFEADLTNQTSATLNFDHYYNIEEDWDFGVVQVSTDNGETWNSLSNENTKNTVVPQGYPTIKDNMPGFTGTNAEWTAESFDLSEYAGEKVLVSFRYLTDWASQEPGWYIKNIEVAEAGFTADGSSVEPFKSLAEVKGEYVDFTVTFIQTKKNGSQKVVHVDPFNVNDKEALQIRNFLTEGNVQMITTYAAKAGDKNPVEFTYEVGLKSNNGKKKIK
ncbi:hypothetical protein ACFOZY_09965 [Chungangia koreensis]|uniref:Immune inhibitor A peptidase M6 n=1 Tax=Chungangia koreensis TaxID=752657 RepID=A0ABV8X6X9_9LACT